MCRPDSPVKACLDSVSACKWVSYCGARITRTRPVITQFGVMLFGTDNRYSIEKARGELGCELQVGLREGIQLAAEWFNAGGNGATFAASASRMRPS